MLCLQSYSNSHPTAVQLVVVKIAAQAFRDTNSTEQLQRPFLLWGRAGNRCCEPYSLPTIIFMPLPVCKMFLIKTSFTGAEIGTQ